MIVEELLKGQSINKIVAFVTDSEDELGNPIEIPIPHSAIEGVRIVMKNRETELRKWSTLSADILDGWEELNVETAEGEFRFFVSSEESTVLPVGLLKIEVMRAYPMEGTQSFIKVNEFTIYNVRTSLTQNHA